MQRRFRFVGERDRARVTLALLRRDGEPLGEVTGPTLAHPVGMEHAEMVRATTPLEAFAAALRMANNAECDLVVTGDVSVWDPAWGNLMEEGGRRTAKPAAA